MIRWMRDAASRCMSAGHEWLAADDPEACPDCIGWALAAAHRAGQEAMRERCAVLVDRAAEEACSCDGTLCGPDDVAPHDADCLAFDMDDLADAIRALEVEP